MIKLEDQEVRRLYSALTIARKFYEERNMAEEAKGHGDLFDLLFHSTAIHVEVGPGLTESGVASLQEILKRRKENMEKESRVLEFPGVSKN